MKIQTEAGLFSVRRSRKMEFHTMSLQARSQNLEKGGAILKEWEVCKRPWLEFSLILNQFQTDCPIIETKCFGKLGNSQVFLRPNYSDLQKKKGLRQNSEWFFGRNPKYKGFFLPKLGDLQKKKKKVFVKIQSTFSAKIQRFFPPKLRWSTKKKKKGKGLHQNWDWYFVQFCKFRRLRGGLFSNGGAIFHFSHKIGLKSTKNMRFCILHKPMGGARAPPAPPPWLRYCESGCICSKYTQIVTTGNFLVWVK